MAQSSFDYGNVEAQVRVRAKQEKIQALQKVIEYTCSLDLIFCVDCTKTMGIYIQHVTSFISEFVQNLKEMNPNIKLRVGFVGYRDHCDKNHRIESCPFTTDISKFIEFVKHVRDGGGGDIPEDVLGGLEVVINNFEYTSHFRVLLHIADAPCHGDRYHDARIKDSYPEGCPRKLTPEILLPKIREKRILYFFARINASTDQMIAMFNEIYRMNYIVTIPLVLSNKNNEKDNTSNSEDAPISTNDTVFASSTELSALVFQIMVKELMESSSTSWRVDRGHMKTVVAWDGSPVSPKSSINPNPTPGSSSSSSPSAYSASGLMSPSIPSNVIELAPPNEVYTSQQWNSIESERVLKFVLKYPKTIQDLLQDQMDDCVECFPLKDVIKIKTAMRPFARGATRVAYRGLEKHYSSNVFIPHIPNSVGYRGVIHKESLLVKGADRTKYVSDLACQRAAIFLSREYNRLLSIVNSQLIKEYKAKCKLDEKEGVQNKKPLKLCPMVNFCECSLIQLVTRLPAQPYLHQEEELQGHFEKYNSNAGHVTPSPSPDVKTRHEVVQAFSHWTHVITKGFLMIVDCQGVYQTLENRFLLTDPAIHCQNALRFGGTNHGEVGFEHFYNSHRCNRYCKLLHINKGT